LGTADNVHKLSTILEPFTQLTVSQFTQEQILLAVECSIRSDIQLKMMLAAISVGANVVGLEPGNVAYLVQLWGAYYTYLCDAVYAAAQLQS
jgi:hypothetical protein